MGTVDVGALAYEKAEVAAAAHAGAYYAMANGGSTASIQTAIQSATPLGASVTATVSEGYVCSNAASLTLVATPPANCSPGVVATYVQIGASAPYTPLVSWGTLNMPTTTLSASALVRIS
jgi:hypothetical protein